VAANNSPNRGFSSPLPRLGSDPELKRIEWSTQQQAGHGDTAAQHECRSSPPWGIVPLVEAGDSLSGIVSRIAAINGVQPRDLWSEFRPESAGRPGEFGSMDLHPMQEPFRSALSRRLSLHPDLLDAGTLKKWHRLITPAGAQDHDLENRHLRWVNLVSSPGCVDCLRERCAHRVVWRLAVLPTCNKHQLTLVWRCPACGKAPYGRPKLATQYSGEPDCQQCGSEASTLRSTQRSLTRVEAEESKRVEDLLQGPLAAEKITTLRVVHHVLKIIRRTPHLSQTLTATVQDAADLDEVLCMRGAGGRTRTHEPPNTSLLAALLPSAVAMAEGRIDQLDTAFARALNTATGPYRVQLPGLSDSDAQHLITRWSEAAKKPRILRSRIELPLLAAIQPIGSRARSDLRIPQLCPVPQYNALFADILSDAEELTHERDSTTQRLTFLTGRRVASALTFLSIRGGSRSAACKSLGIPPSPTTVLITRVLKGLQELDQTTKLLEAVRSCRDELSASTAPDYVWRVGMLTANRESLLDRVTRLGVPEALAWRWLVEFWACAEPAQHGLSTQGPNPDGYLHLLTANFEDTVDRLGRAAKVC